MSQELRRLGGSRFFFGFGLCLAILLSLSALPAWSQATSNATITGLVTDESGAAVVGAMVKIVDSATGSAQSTTTNDQGRYVFATVTPDTYVITITKEGFQAFRIGAQKVDVGTAI